MPSTSFNPLDYGAEPLIASTPQTPPKDKDFDPTSFGAVPVSGSSKTFDPTEFGATPISPSNTPTQDDGSPEFIHRAKEIWNSDAEGLPEKLWDIANTPLVDLKREGAHGVEAGAEEFASGLTSPLSAGLMLATAGVGPLLGRLGLDAAAMGTTQLLKSAKTVSKLASVGFTAMQMKGIADQSPEFIKAIRDGDTDKALEMGTGMLLQAGTAALGAKHAASELGLFGKEPDAVTPSDRLMGHWTANLKKDTDVATRFNVDLKKEIPNQVDREALHFYGEAGGDIGKLADWQKKVAESGDIAPDLQRQVVRDLQKAQSLDPKVIQKVDTLRNMYEDVHRRATAVKPDGTPADTHIMEGTSHRDNYFARAPWEHEPDALDNVDEAKSILGDSTQNHTQRRVFETTVDGLLQGFKPRKVQGRYSLDSADLASDYYRNMGREMAKKQFVEMAKNGYGSDNRPLAVPGGTISKFESSARDKQGVLQPTGEEKTLLDSDGLNSHALNKVEVSKLRAKNQLQDMIDSGKIVDRGENLDKKGDYPGRYRYSTDDYDNSVQSRYAKTAVWGGNDGTLLRSNFAFHPELATAAKQILAPERSWLQKNPFTSKVIGLSTQAKQSLLSLSGFHWVQIGLRGLESGINPLKPALEMIRGEKGWDLDNPLNPDRARQLKLIESNGIMPGITSGSNSFAEGLQGHGIVSKVPGVGKVVDSVNNALFGPNGYIDRIKLNAALDFERRLRPMIADDSQRYKAAGQLANQRFGGLNYLAMGRSQTARDIMRLTLLAPDWLESNLRDAASTLGPYGKLSRYDFARIALYNFVTAQTLNMLTTGKMHLDQPFGVVSPDGKKVYTVRTLPSDMYHALTQPMDYASNRLNPLLARTGVEAITGRDKQGHIRNLGDQIKDLFENITPIPLHGVTNALTGNFRPGESAGDYVRSAMGLTTKANHSPAEELAFKLSSQSSSSHTLPSDQAAHMHRVMEYEDRLRDGDKDALQDMQKDVDSGRLAIHDLRQITHGATTSRLQAVVNRLSMSQAADVWHLATKEEREQLSPVMVKKIQDFRATEGQKLTPAEREHMDTKIAAVMSDLFDHAGIK